MPDTGDPLSKLEARALSWLARREYTRVELARKLAGALRSADRAKVGAAAGNAPGREARRNLEQRPADEFAPAPQLQDTAEDQLQTDGVERLDAGARAALIDTLVDRLAEQGLLSDVRAAEAIVHARGRQRGLLRVAHELEQKGVPGEIAARVLADLREQQVPAAREVWLKRFGELPVDAGDRARQTRFLASRGFSFEVIRAVLGGEGE
jgi:regulatory protein